MDWLKNKNDITSSTIVIFVHNSEYILYCIVHFDITNWYKPKKYIFSQEKYTNAKSSQVYTN